MKAAEWHRFLEDQRMQHGKVIFRVAELANAAGCSHHALNNELIRLVRNGVLVRYATGIYGIPGAVTPEQLVATLDANAYLTGMFALYRHNLISQAPVEITCFTNRRHSRSRERLTPLGKLVFVYVSRRIYAKPAGDTLAAPEQAFYDFVHIVKRQGLDPVSLVTFKNLSRFSRKQLARLAHHYPASVGEIVRKLLGGTIMEKEL